MKLRKFMLVLAAMAMTSVLCAQTNNDSRWVGVWEGQDPPGVTVTLGNDAGDLQGTIVFKFIAPESSVIGHDAHVLTHVNLNDSTLAFHSSLGGSRERRFTLKLTGDGKAVLECADCGGSGAIELSRIK